MMIEFEQEEQFLQDYCDELLVKLDEEQNQNLIIQAELEWNKDQLVKVHA